MSEQSVPRAIEQFLEQTTEDIDSVVVEGKDFDEVKEHAEVEGSGLNRTHTINGVPIRWRGKPHTGIEARIKVNNE